MKRILVLFLLVMELKVFAQDPQFSQYYSAPLLLNPALTGTADCYRLGMNARTQWTGLPGGAFNTASVYADLNHPDLRSGFGILAVHDNVGTPRMSSNEISGLYSYLAPVSSLVNFRFGIQANYVSRSLDYSRLYFEDQYTGVQVTSPVSKDPMINYRNVNYADFSAGMIAFGDGTYWLGFSAHHLNRPHDGFYLDSRLPIKYSLHGGYNFYFNKYSKSSDDDIRIIPTFMYKSQGKFDQLDIGLYFIRSGLLLGAWYRGIPVKKDYLIYNRDAIDLQAGIKYNDFSFIYSYDFTISRLSIRNTHGSHEISMVYVFCLEWPKRRKPPRHVRKLPCPDFDRSMRYKKNYLGF